jgi:transposase-like protein
MSELTPQYIATQEINILGQPVVCRFCDSKNVIRRGQRKSKNCISQRFGCKNCGRRFTLYENSFRKMGYKPEIVSSLSISTSRGFPTVIL